MSVKHPIISVTGSSGAGTTSVRKTFETIFRREGIEAVYVEGDLFHRYDRAEMRAEMAAQAERGNKHFSHFSPESNLFDRLETLFAEFGATGKGLARHYIHDDEEATLYGGKPGAFTPWEPLPPADLLLYEGLHGAVVDRRRRRRKARRCQDRRRPGHQPRVDPEAASGPQRPRLFDRSGHRHDPSPDAGLCELHLPAVRPYRHQLPARAHGRHFESLHRALDPDGGRIDGRDPVQESARHRFSRICFQ